MFRCVASNAVDMRVESLFVCLYVAGEIHVEHVCMPLQLLHGLHTRLLLQVTCVFMHGSIRSLAVCTYTHFHACRHMCRSTHTCVQTPPPHKHPLHTHTPSTHTHTPSTHTHTHTHTHTGVPGSPAPVIVSEESVNSRNASVSWHQPFSLINISHYIIRVVQLSSNDILRLNIPANSLQFVITDLQPNRPHMVYVSAVNRAGVGEETGSEMFTTLEDGKSCLAIVESL